MQIVLLTKHNSYVGREYACAMKANGIPFSVVSLGEEDSSSIVEDERCGGLWSPASWEEVTAGVSVVNCPSLTSNEFEQSVILGGYRLAIQGNVGEIIKNKTISLFRDGVLNFHPGDLPLYRGCSAPEWQLYEDNPVVSTCHYLDTGIDTGEIIAKKQLGLDYQSYHHFRAGIYPQTAIFLVEILKKYLENGALASNKQNEQNAKYRKYIGEEKIEELKIKLEGKRIATL